MANFGGNVRAALIVGAAVAVTSCDEPGELYQRPPAEFRDLLRTGEVPLYMFGSSAESEAIVDGSDPAAIACKIIANQRSLMTFTARIAPEGGSATRVTVDVEGAPHGQIWRRPGAAGESEGDPDAVPCQHDQAVDSTLDGRAFDISRTYPALITAGTANTARLFPPSSGDSRPPATGNHR